MNWIKKWRYLVPIIVCVLGIMAIGYYYFVGCFSKLDTTGYVYIDDNDNLDSVFVKLEPIASDHGLMAFKMMSRHGGYCDNIRSGRYAISPDQSTIRVFRNLKNGHQDPVRLTIPECRTMDRLAGFLSKKLMMDSVAVSILFSDSSFCAQQGYDTATIACLFIPNTYEVYWNISIENLMKRMKKENENFWNTQRNIKAESLGLTKEQVCTIASIIDEETANNAEKPMIAGMYINRLNAGMPLQADPTIKFALKQFELKRIWQKLLTTDSPYNTYKNTGLPPGPIKIASIQGIDAVLNAVSHDYLYMCAKEDFSGTHNFAKTYQEHLKNAAKYTKALNERGIK